MLKKTVWIVLAIALMAAVGYFFIYPYDYMVRFTADTIPGTINQSVKIWHKENGVPGSAISQEDLRHLQEEVMVGDSVHSYQWEINPIDAETSQVIVKVRDRDHSLGNKWDVLFGNSLVERQSRRMVRTFAEELNAHLDLFNVSIVGEAELPSTFYAYVNLKTSQHGKAGGMMDNYMLLTELLMQNQVTLNGPPMIVVNQWDQQKDSLDFNFCFPIVRSDRLPQHPDVQYKRIFPERALKAEYNGNYITSDRAWYALLDYAREHNIPVDPTPVEVFFNNPTLGGDALRWKAEIYLPIVESE
ncbi:GyrI-like domain-containing protein [Robiginitalea sp. M366]|uniref:GyrI-like domain-containing protein n=1 Tax=Robiginitalea aestuariiviva TaxID=3036903 RepID=UPI00240D6042|nr:GyrI-like domain-containing protein [Robiginitalea aestuariiviva]MDG1571808.1 GyrI-like domain-containing protein [Robiginitalea aestuariiviva]